jgi:hypothetical protein
MSTRQRASRAFWASKNSDGSQMQGAKRKILKTFLQEYSGSRTTSNATCCSAEPVPSVSQKEACPFKVNENFAHKSMVGAIRWNSI